MAPARKGAAVKVTVKESRQHGKGVFAAAPIVRDEPIIVFGGPRLHRSQVDWSDYHLQIDEDLYLGPSGSPDDFINHSCDPNSAFRQGLVLVALRDIAVGEEITWDYGTAIDEHDFPGFPCCCGAANCRGLVRSFRDLERDVQQRLRPWLLPYLQQKYFPG